MSPARTGLKAAVASAAAVALLSTGAAFAASGHAPWAHAHVSAGASADHSKPTHPTPSHSESSDDPSSDDPSDGTGDGTGPNAHAMWGLCHAYLAGSKTEHGQALQSPAFSALAQAAGGADLVSDFCATVPRPGSGHESGHPSHPAHPAHPTHPAKPTQAASPTHPAHPTHPAKPTQAASPTHPAHPTHSPSSPSHPAHPSHSTAPSSHSSAHSRP